MKRGTRSGGGIRRKNVSEPVYLSAGHSTSRSEEEKMREGERASRRGRERDGLTDGGSGPEGTREEQATYSTR